MEQKKQIIGILSLGCPKNLVDSEVLLGLLAEAGYVITYDVTDCDVALLNTCSFIEDAYQESVDMIDELLSLKKEGRIKHLIVCGCLPQRYPDGIKEIAHEVDAYIGTGDIEHIVDVVNKIVHGNSVVQVGKPGYLYSHNTPRYFLTPPFSKYVKIAEGCDHACSFCVIPQMRGKHRSRPIESIVAEVKQLVDAGMKECVLVSQNTTYYGMDVYGKLALADLLHELNKINGLSWIRTLYMYPRHVTKELISVFKESEKICKYMDLSLQHINNDILKSMHRGTTKEKITEMINTIRAAIPGVYIRTSFIVGYPGEDYTAFNELLQYIEEMQFERLGAFMYSREEGSPAATLEGEVSEEVKKSRFQDIMLLQQKISRKNNEKLQGKTFTTLIEGKNPDRPGYFVGRTYMDAPEVDGLVYIKEDSRIQVGEFYSVTITDFYEYDLEGIVTS